MPAIVHQTATWFGFGPAAETQFRFEVTRISRRSSSGGAPGGRTNGSRILDRLARYLDSGSADPYFRRAA